MKGYRVSWLSVLVGLAVADHYPWSQCGGEGYSGATECPKGYVCTNVNSSYMQCVESGKAPVPEYSARNPYSTAYVPPTSEHAPPSSRYVPTLTSEHYVPSETSDYVPTQTSSDHVPPPTITQEQATEPSPVTAKGEGNFTAVVGLKGVELRLPVHKLQSDHPDVFNMFVLALEALEKLPESFDLSYYQISGIHGRPFIAWQYETPAAGDYPYGYCTHDSVIFCTWHRPYISLFEQLLVEHAEKIAGQFKGDAATKYQAAAKKVRIPYWDWASDDTESRIPQVVATPQIAVTKPGADGAPSVETIRNPLYSYVFTNDQYRDTYFDGIPQEPWTETLRRPEGNPPVSRNDLVSDALASTFAARKLSTFQLFGIGTFGRFSTTRFMNETNPIDFASVEQIHNTIHGAVGFTPSFGHMSSVQVAAFDPIFLLHHSQVDRLTAMYQAIYPGRVVAPLSRTELNYAYHEPGGIEDIDTKLYPFRHPNGEEWTSRDVSDAASTWQYGYAYPEVPVEYQDKSAAELTAFTADAVKKLYAPSGQGFTPSPGNGTTTRTEYLAHVTFDESQIDGTFSLWIYAGEIPSGNELLTHENLVGGVTSFTGGHQKHRSVIAGTVPLTQALLTKNISTTGTACVDYLKEHLDWKVLQGHTEVGFDQLPSLQVGVSACKVTYYDDPTKLPTYGEWEIHYDVTNSKSGGLRTGHHHNYSYNGPDNSTTSPVKKVARGFSS